MNGSDRKDANSFFNAIKNVDLLVVDELGKETGGHSHIIGELETMLKERDMFKKPTILISNENYEELVSRYTTEASDFSSVFMKSYRILLFNPANDFRKITRVKWYE